MARQTCRANDLMTNFVTSDEVESADEENVIGSGMIHGAAMQPTVICAPLNKLQFRFSLFEQNNYIHPSSRLTDHIKV